MQENNMWNTFLICKKTQKTIHKHDKTNDNQVEDQLPLPEGKV